MIGNYVENLTSEKNVFDIINKNNFINKIKINIMFFFQIS